MVLLPAKWVLAARPATWVLEDCQDGNCFEAPFSADLQKEMHQAGKSWACM